MMKGISRRMDKQRREETMLARQLVVGRAQGLCEICRQPPDWRGLSKHEKVKRSQGGDPLDPENCVMLCGRCHSREHGIKEV